MPHLSIGVLGGLLSRTPLRVRVPGSIPGCGVCRHNYSLAIALIRNQVTHVECVPGSNLGGGVWGHINQTRSTGLYSLVTMYVLWQSTWWDGRVAYCAGFENRCPRGLMGSNPIPTVGKLIATQKASSFSIEGGFDKSGQHRWIQDPLAQVFAGSNPAPPIKHIVCRSNHSPELGLFGIQVSLGTWVQIPPSASCVRGYPSLDNRSGFKIRGCSASWVRIPFPVFVDSMGVYEIGKSDGFRPRAVGLCRFDSYYLHLRFNSSMRCGSIKLGQRCDAEGVIL